MPALASLPSPAPSGSLVEPDVPVVPFLGRSLAEYTQFFALNLVALKGRDVLDVGAGPSSFTAEACARRIDAVAVDPGYGEPATQLAAWIERDSERMSAQWRALPRLQRGRTYSAWASGELDRRAAAQRFLGDYETHFAYGRYVSGSLPRLPFFDGTFDLVLCAHVLFAATARFDFDWHLAACRELVRVSADEVRVFPLCGAEGKPFPGLARLRRELRATGVSSQLVGVDYEFLAGANTMLVLRRAAP